jgi:hypothetical protein
MPDLTPVAKNKLLFIYLYISPSIYPLQGRRPPGCGSSQDTLNSYKKYY